MPGWGVQLHRDRELATVTRQRAGGTSGRPQPIPLPWKDCVSGHAKTSVHRHCAAVWLRMSANTRAEGACVSVYMPR